MKLLCRPHTPKRASKNQELKKLGVLREILLTLAQKRIKMVDFEEEKSLVFQSFESTLLRPKGETLYHLFTTTTRAVGNHKMTIAFIIFMEMRKGVC